MAEKEVSTGPELTEVEEPKNNVPEDSGVVNNDSQPFPTDGRVESTIEGVDSDADDFIESPTGEEQRIEVSPESDQYVAPEDDDELDPDEDDDEK